MKIQILNLLYSIIVITSLGLVSCSNDETKDPKIEQENKIPIFVNTNSDVSVETIKIATFNMWIGFDSEKLLKTIMLFPNAPDKIKSQARNSYMEIKSNMPETRVQELASIIVENDIPVLGLQEVMRLYVNETLEIDFLDILISELQNLGYEYKYFYQETTPLTLIMATDGQESILTFSEGNAIIIKNSFSFIETESLFFNENFSINLSGKDSEIQRGLQYARIKTDQGGEFDFYNTHLELLYLPGYQEKQAEELKKYIKNKSSDSIPTIVVGDFNSEGTNGGANIMLKYDFLDTYNHMHGETNGATCCYMESVEKYSTLSQRIDYIFARSIVKGVSSSTGITAKILKEKSDELDSPDFIWISDHAGVITEIEIVQ